MPPQRNEWFVPRSGRDFARQVVSTHARVEDFSCLDGVYFEITREGGLSDVNALVVDRYVIGLADVMAAQEAFPGLNCIFASGNWCGYTQEAKEYGLRSGVAVFHVGEFSAALWRRNFVNYCETDSRGDRYYAYKTAPPY